MERTAPVTGNMRPLAQQSVRSLQIGVRSQVVRSATIRRQSETMKSNDLKLMSVDELWTLHAQVSSVLANRLVEEKTKIEKRLRQLKPDGASNSGFQRARRPYPQVHPKYRNPAQPAETWSGRGKQPRWLTAQLRSGKKLDNFRIQPSSSHERRLDGGRKARRAQGRA
jgi:DNA-binding protein H-NS